LSLSAPRAAASRLCRAFWKDSDLDAVVLVVLHRSANRVSYLRDIFVRNVLMPVVVPRHR
jgi:hypothetical protein